MCQCQMDSGMDRNLVAGIEAPYPTIDFLQYLSCYRQTLQLPLN